MQFSLSSKYDSSRKVKLIVDIITWTLRIVVGIVFLFSGFVKSIDSWGTIYKFEEYLQVFNFNFPQPLLLGCVLVLCTFEFLIGFSILTGSYRKSSPVLALCLMIVMLPLTLWIAISNPVKDCGCFGDFLIISNWGTFIKNVLLTIFIIWLIKYNKIEFALINPAIQWIGIVVSIFFILIIQLSGYFMQPLVDFRAYHEGEPLISREESESEPVNYVFLYEKEGQRKEVGIYDELPSEEDGWEFIERKELKSEANIAKDEKSFRIWDKSGENDITEEVLSDNNKILLLLMSDLNEVSPATTWKINTLYDISQKDNIDMIAVVSGSVSQIDEWADLSMPEYPIYVSDDTTIKEIARGNPAVVYVEDGNIVWKSSLSSVNIDTFSKEEKINLKDLKIDYNSILRNLILIYLICIAALASFSIIPWVKRCFTRDGKAHP